MLRYGVNDVFVLPEGLKELLSDISREVLREQPDNLYDFIANYLEALLLTRKNLSVADSLLRQMQEDLPEEYVKRLVNLQCDDLQVQGTGIIDSKVTIIQENVAKVQLKRLEGKHPSTTLNNTKIYKQDKPTNDELNRSVDVIKMAYKTHYRDGVLHRDQNNVADQTEN